jgi:hypothetical protein
VRDTLRYDRSGNLTQRRDGLAGYVTEYLYPSASNRLGTQRDSTVGTPGHSDRSSPPKCGVPRQGTPGYS